MELVLALIIGLVVGFGMSIPPGPISVAVIRQGIQGNMRAGLQIGFGATLMDLIYAFAAASASSAIIVNLAKFINGHAWLELAFQVVCIILLVVLGKKYITATTEDLQESTDEELKQESKVQKLGFTSPYMLGILMGVMNLANPSFLPSLIFVSGFVQAKGWIASSAGHNALYAIGFGAGVFIWFTILLRLIIRLRDRLPATYFTYIFKFAGGAFFLFAVILAVRVAIATEWGAVF